MRGDGSGKGWGCFVIALALAACAGAEQEAPAPQAAPAVPSAAGPASSGGGGVLSSEDAARFCVTLHEQMVPCAPEFIDMTMDLRAKYFPAFAQAIADPAARAQRRDEGVKETVADGSGPLEARLARCKQYVEHGPPVPSADAASAAICFSKATCAEKIACLRPSQEQRFQDRASAPGQSTPEGAPKMK